MIRAFFKKLNHNLSIKKKIALSYIFLILIPVCLMMGFYYTKTSSILEKGITNSVLQALKQTEINISYKFAVVENLSDVLFMNNDLHTYLSRDDENTSIGQKIDDSNELNKIITGGQSSKDIYRVRLFVDSKKLYSGELINFFPLDLINKEDWYKKVVENNGRTFWRNTSRESVTKNNYADVISCMRMLRHKDRYDQLVGVLAVDIQEKDIYGIISENNVTDRQNIFIMDSDGIIISHYDKSRIGTAFFDNSEVNGRFGSEEGIFKLGGNSDAAYIIYKGIAKTGWMIVSYIPVSEINKSNDVFNSVSGVIVIIISLIVFMLALFLFAAFLTEGMNKRIRSLVHTIEKEGIGSIEGYAASEGDMNKLEKSFEVMVKTVKELAEESFIARLNVREAELKALQAQINPHFLYNTLDMINWMAIRRNAEDISETIDSLTRYFRYSLSKGKDIVSISDELELAKAYLSIQKKRFGDIFSVEFHVGKDVKQFKIPKLIIQPVIENAILHGIQERDDKNGLIKILAEKNRDDIIISVKDNGIGIKEEKLRDLLKDGMQSGNGSYGLYNINERIRLFCGDEYGIGITSTEGEGTTVIIRLRAISES